MQNFAVWMTRRAGSVGFFACVLGWTIAWLAWNTAAPSGMQFDPFPGFVLWLFISNVIQLLLLPLIMVGQQVLGRKSDARADADYAVDVKAEGEIAALARRLEDVAVKLGV